MRQAVGATRSAPLESTGRAGQKTMRRQRTTGARGLDRHILLVVRLEVDREMFQLSSCWCAGIFAIALVVGVAAVAVAHAQAARAGSKKWPPQFPREGATLLFENEHVVV